MGEWFVSMAVMGKKIGIGNLVLGSPIIAIEDTNKGFSTCFRTVPPSKISITKIC
jgi:hypothetical protein